MAEIETTEYHTYEYIGNQTLMRDDGLVMKCSDLGGAVFTWKKDKSFYTAENWSDCQLYFGVNTEMVADFAIPVMHSPDGQTYKLPYSTGFNGYGHYGEACCLNGYSAKDDGTYGYTFNTYQYGETHELWTIYWDGEKGLVITFSSSNPYASEDTPSLMFYLGGNSLSVDFSDMTIDMESSSYPYSYTDVPWEVDAWYSKVTGVVATAANWLLIPPDTYGITSNADTIDYVLSHFDYNNGGTWEAIRPSFKHYEKAGTIGNGTVKFRHYAYNE